MAWLKKRRQHSAERAGGAENSVAWRRRQQAATHGVESIRLNRYTMSVVTSHMIVLCYSSDSVLGNVTTSGGEKSAAAALKQA